MNQLGCFTLEDTITDQVKYMFQPVDPKQPEGTKRDLYIPARIRKTVRLVDMIECTFRYYNIRGKAVIFKPLCFYFMNIKQLEKHVEGHVFLLAVVHIYMVCTSIISYMISVTNKGD